MFIMQVYDFHFFFKFFFVLIQKRTKKDQGKTNGSARFARPAHGTSLPFLLQFITQTVFLIPDLN